MQRLAVRGDSPSTTMVVMEPVVEGMGLDWKSQHTKLGFFDASSGSEEVAKGCCDQVDEAREGSRISIAPGSGPGGLEDAVEAFEAGVRVAGGPAAQDAFGVKLVLARLNIT